MDETRTRWMIGCGSGRLKVCQDYWGSNEGTVLPEELGGLGEGVLWMLLVVVVVCIIVESSSVIGYC